MSKCPKCGKKLRAIDLSQTCPHCGVNMRFYDFDKRFLRDAKAAELSMAKVSIKLRRLKAALIGGKLPKLRLVLMLLPLLSTLIPTANVAVKLPYISKDVPLSALGLYGMFTDGLFGFVGAMSSARVAGGVFAQFQNVLYAFAGVAVCAVLVFLFSLLCFINIKRMAVVQCVTSALGAAGCVAVAVLTKKFLSVSSEALSGTMSFGFVVTLVMFLAVFAVNAVIAAKGIEIEYEEGTLERAEIAKKVKRGELKLDDLPQPIVQTAETRRIDEEIALQQGLYSDEEVKAE